MSQGHRHFVLIGGNPNSNVQNDRIGGMRSSLSSTTVHETLWIEDIERMNGSGCDLGMSKKFQQGFTAFCAVSDLHALRVLMELQRAGISVPKDASVTGFDDLIWSSVVAPSLTTMRMDMATIAEIAVASLLKDIETSAGDAASRKIGLSPAKKPAKSLTPSVPMHLIIRQSSGPAPLVGTHPRKD
jgi:LacI family transcriptional regulator